MSQIWDPVLKPMLVGSIPLGLISALAFYIATYWSVSTFQQKRRERLANKAKTRLTSLTGKSPA